jgi:hypothetical protein
MVILSTRIALAKGSFRMRDTAALLPRSSGRLAGKTELREVDHQAASEIVNNRDGMLGREWRERVHRYIGDEATLRKIASVHLCDCASARRNRAGVIVEVCAIGRSDFHQRCATSRHDVGNAEASSDLHQLAARYDHLAVARESAQCQDQRSCTVVDDDRVLGAA